MLYDFIINANITFLKNKNHFYEIFSIFTFSIKKNFMNFNEYLYTDAQDIEQIFNFYNQFLNELLNKGFPKEMQLQLKGASDKFLNSIEKFTYFETYKREEYEELVNELIYEFKILTELSRKAFILKLIPFINNRKKQLFKIQDIHFKVYSATMSLINDSIQKEYLFDELELGDFYKPNKSNKTEIIELINEAIELIKEDFSITEKSKKSLINHLNKAIGDLNSQRTNWTRFFGKIKEVSVLLSALGSLAGNSHLLYDAITKLEKASIVIRKTSINLSYSILNDIFNVENIQNLGLLKSTILKIDDSTSPPIDISNDEISE